MRLCADVNQGRRHFRGPLGFKPELHDGTRHCAQSIQANFYRVPGRNVGIEKSLKSSNKDSLPKS